MTLHMETTKVPVTQTVAEIEELLISHGASRVWKECDPVAKTIESVCFSMMQDGVLLSFKLPFLWREIQAMAERGETGKKATANEDQARRVAARLCLRWFQAQYELMRIGASLEQTMMPFLLDDKGNTFAELIAQRGGLGSLMTLPGK